MWFFFKLILGAILFFVVLSWIPKILKGVWLLLRAIWMSFGYRGSVPRENFWRKECKRYPEDQEAQYQLYLAIHYKEVALINCYISILRKNGGVRICKHCGCPTSNSDVLCFTCGEYGELIDQFSQTSAKDLLINTNPKHI